MAQVVHEDEAACLEWEYNGAYYGDYAELAAGFKMGYANSTVRALYAKDFTETFTPSCRIKYRGTNQQLNEAMSHETLEGLTGRGIY